MRLESTDGVELEVHDLGGAGEPLLLAHATGFCGAALWPLGSLLRERFHVWSFDFRSHGGSTRPVNGRLDWHAMADDVLTVAGPLGDGAVAVGHSMGATALLLAEQRIPGRWRALVTFETIAFPVPPGTGRMADHPLASGAERRRERFPSRRAARDHFASKPPLSALSPGALDGYVDHGFAPDPEAGGEAVRLACRPADEAEVYRWGAAHGALDGMASVTCPTTVVRGGRSSDVSAELTELQASLHPAGRAVVVPHVGHFGPMEDPPAVAAVVLDALAPG